MPKIIKDLPEKLIEETRRQVMEVGYAALNIRTVAQNCGVGVGTVYNYFPSKEALVAQFLLQDWRKSMEQIRNGARECSGGEGVLSVIYQELRDFYMRYEDLFHAASATIPAPPRQYHAILRNQIAQVLRPWCDDDFTADFSAEALLTWTVEGKSFSQIAGLLKKVMAR